MAYSGLQSAYLRLALRIIMDRHGQTANNIAATCQIEVASIRNLFNTRNKTTHVPELVNYVTSFPSATDIELLHVQSKLLEDRHLDDSPLLNYLYPLAIRGILNLGEHHEFPHLQQYCGSYLVHRQAFDPSKISTIWLNICDASAEINFPTYRLFQRTTTHAGLEGKGFVIPSPNHLSCVGHRGVPYLEMALLNRIQPPVQFLTGIALTTSRRGQIFSAKIYCERLSEQADVDRAHYDDLVGTHLLPDFRGLMEKHGHDANAVGRILFHIDNCIDARKPRSLKVLSERSGFQSDFEAYSEE